MTKTNAKTNAKHPTTPGTLSLFTGVGERKYLSAQERARFLSAAERLDNPAHHTFCAMLYWTGCRPGEARAMSAVQIDLEARAVIIGTLKKRGREKGRHFRSVPVPDEFLALLDRVHGISALQRGEDPRCFYRLWPYSRTKAWRLVHDVMTGAGITGVRASARGLRHSYGVKAAMTQVPITRIKSWLGHASLETTEIYLDITGAEDRALAERMW